MRHGVFLGPWHDVTEDPTRAIHRDLALMGWLDELGFDEAWIGEHHSAGWEIISSPELFIAAAAERTRRLRFGTGVVSLPYHNPLMVAQRIVQLDHMTMGRVMFGVGPGLLPSDALMLGIAPEVTRDRMAEALDVILRLFDGEVVTETTDWYELHDARLHLLPYTRPRPEVAVASVQTPSGGRMAGRYGLSMLCVAASHLQAFNALETNWEIADSTAAAHGMTVDRKDLRLVAPMHLAETRRQARRNVQFGLGRFIEYTNINNAKLFDMATGADPVDHFVESGYAVIGTPDDAIDMITRLQDKQGEFGCFLTMAHDWADYEQTKRSFELYARYVIPHFSGANSNREASLRSVAGRRVELTTRRGKAAELMFEKHAAETRRAQA